MALQSRAARCMNEVRIVIYDGARDSLALASRRLTHGLTFLLKHTPACVERGRDHPAVYRSSEDIRHHWLRTVGHLVNRYIGQKESVDIAFLTHRS